MEAALSDAAAARDALAAELPTRAPPPRNSARASTQVDQQLGASAIRALVSG